MKNQKTPSQIIQEIIESLNMSIRSFALNMDEPYTKVFDIARGRTKTISRPLVKKISSYYNINETYILSGVGSMFKETPLNKIEEAEDGECPQTSDEVVQSCLSVISKLSDENKRQKQLILEMKEEIERMKAENEMLKNGNE